jgi:hypothetical protein
LFGIAFINWWVVECVPLSVAGIAAFRRIMAEINLARVIDYTDQVIDGVFDRGMTTLLDERREVEGLANLDAIVELELAILAIWKSLELKNNDFG